MGGAGAIQRFLDRSVDFARHRPGTVLIGICIFHIVVWTVLPLLVCHNLQLDLVEDLAMGREWQLGYWKHPPLPWWTADVLYRLTGQIDSIYLLGPLAAVACFYGVWLLAREVLDDLQALIAVAALEAIHFYNFSVVKFAHDQMQLPFWAFTGLFFYRALVRGRMLDWALAGLFLAGAFWSKYAAFVLAASLGLFLLIDPVARRAWRTPGPYVMAIVFAVVFAPNAWWLVTHDFLPFTYVSDRAAHATRWYQYATFPLLWIGNSLVLLLAPLLLLFLLFALDGQWRKAADDKAAFDRRIVTMLALGPFVVTTVVTILTARMPVAMWAYPLWSFGPLALLLWLAPALDTAHLRRFVGGAAVILVAVPIIYLIAELGEPLIRDRPKATQFPGRLFAETITKEWRERTGTPLRYVAGAKIVKMINGVPVRVSPGRGEFGANNVAVYSPDRPHVVVHGDPDLSPWIDRDDLDRAGAVLVWDDEPQMPQNLRETFPRAEQPKAMVLTRRTLYPRSPEIVHYAIVPPRS